MAEDASTTAPSETQPRDPEAVRIQDGSSNTVVLEEDVSSGIPGDTKPGRGNTDSGNGGEPTVIGVGGGGTAAPPSAQPSGPNEVGIIAQRDTASGEITLFEGASTGGSGPLHVAGTDLVFDNQDDFEAFLAKVNAEEDAGKTFEEILGSNASAIPIIENGALTGETLADLDEPGAAASANGVPAAPEGDGRPSRFANGAEDGGDTAPNGTFVRERDGEGRAVNTANGQLENEHETESANGAFVDRNANGVNDAFETLVDPVGDIPAPNGPAVADGNTFADREAAARHARDSSEGEAPAGDGEREAAARDGERRPGRDADGNLLPGAEGRVTLDDFRRINDPDGDGILGSPVDLGGDAGAAEDSPNGGRRPGRDEDGNLLPGAEGRINLDDFRRINDRDGDGILDGIENPVDLRGDRDPAPRFDPPTVRPGLEIPADIELPGRGPTFEPGGDGTPDIPGRGPTVVIDPIFPVTPPPPAAGHGPATPPPNTYPAAPAQPPASNGVTAPLAQSPVNGAAAEQPADAAPIAAVDTFDTGTAPSAATPVAPPPAEEPVVTAFRAPAAAETAPPPEAAAVLDEDCEPEGGGPGAGLAVGATIAPLGGAVLAATDVFDAATIGAAVTTAVNTAKEDGGGNLLERIFDRVKDLLFESGPSASPVQLPVDVQVPATQPPDDRVPTGIDPIVGFAPEEPPISEDALDSADDARAVRLAASRAFGEDDDD